LTIASTSGSETQLAKPVSRVAVITHGKAQTIGPALARLESVARDAGVELLLPDEELEKHVRGPAADGDVTGAELVVVLGGDGTMLRALGRFLDTGVPVIGVNFGRVGFLASIKQDRLEADLARVFAGEYQVVELPTLDAEVEGQMAVAVNDVVVASSVLGRMVELGWAVGNEDLGRQPCDGVICSTPSGSTAYNLSNGGPVLVWGLDAMAITFVSPHSLHARPLVVPRGRDLIVWNRTADVPVTVLIDGHAFAEVQPAGRVVVGLGDRRSLLATLPETTFFMRYRDTFIS
jgi:NAD+ kinase